jgi:hypothetical protein
MGGRRRDVVVMATLVALGTVGGQAVAGRRAAARPAAVAQDLTASAVAPAASGQARLVLRSDTDGRFEIVARDLQPHASFDVILHGIRIGRLATHDAGTARLRFRSRPRGRTRWLGFDPRGLPLTVHDAAGREVLAGTLPEIDPGTGPCCLPDGDAAACEMHSAEECDAAGGTVPDAASCLTNPCDNATPGGRGFVCCLPCGDPPVCEDRSEDDCLRDDGVLLEAGSCDPNPCAPTAPSDVQCCLGSPDDGYSCQERRADDCAAEGGIEMGIGSCDPSPCP